MYIAWLKPRMCACALSLSKGRPPPAQGSEARAFRQACFDKRVSTGSTQAAQAMTTLRYAIFPPLPLPGRVRHPLCNSERR